MPFCVNCGSPVDKGATICSKCGNDPWSLAEDSLVEVDRKLSGASSSSATGVALVSFIVLAGAFILLFGVTIWQLGVFKTGGSSGGYEDGYYEDRAAAPAAKSMGAPYHVYQAFNFGAFLPVVALIGSIILIYCWIRLQAMISENPASAKVLAIALCGTVFIILSMFIFIFGFHDLLNFSGGETWKKPTFTQQYGWIIETLVFGLLGYALLAVAERMRRGLSVGRPIFQVMTAPVFHLFFFAAVGVYAFGFHGFIYAVDYTDYRNNLGWVVEVLVFAAVAMLMHVRAEAARKTSTGIKSLLSAPYAIASALFFIVSIFVYVYGVNSSFWDLKENVDWKWAAETLAFAAPGAIFVTKADRVLREAGWSASIIPRFLLPASAVMFMASMILYIVAVHASVYWTTQVNESWILELVLFAVPAVCLLLVSDRMMNLEKGGVYTLSYYTIPISGIFLLASLVVYLTGVHATVWARGYDRSLSWVSEFFAFLVPGVIALMLGYRNVVPRVVKKGSFIKPYALFTAVVLVIAAVLAYVIGISAVFAEKPIKAVDFIRVIVETVLFAAPLSVLLVYADKALAGKSGDKSILPPFLAFSSAIILLGFSFVYMLGIFEAMSYAREKNLALIIEAILFLIPGLYLLWNAEAILRRDGMKTSLVKNALTTMGSVFLIATLFFAYFLGIHSVFSDPPPDMKRLTQVLLATIVLGAPALVFLLAADDMRKKTGEKTFIAKVLLPASYILLLMSTFVYLLGIQEVFGEKEYRDVWVVEALLYLIPGAYFLVRSDAVNRKEGVVKSSLTRPLYVIGGLCIAATLLSFVFGFNDFLYAEKQDMAWLAKTVAYMVPAAICLYLAEKLK